MPAAMRQPLILAAILSLGACVADDDATSVSQEVAGTPDELALLRFLNDPSTTLTVLDDQVPLDRRAATNLIAHREHDPFDTAAEVDAVAYVGPSAMDALLDYALAGGWVHDDEVFGTFDGVAFTVAEARAAVTLADTASAATLHDAVGLDPRAVDSIVAARPITTMSQLSGLYYVGPSMMGRIRTYVKTPTSCGDDALVGQLRTAIDGMWLTSESDYPVEVASWSGKASSGASASAFIALLGLPPGTTVRVNTIDWLMERLGYSNEPEKVEALRVLLAANLTQIVVYEVGEIQVHDYLVGVTACGGLVGITSISIET